MTAPPKVFQPPFLHGPKWFGDQRRDNATKIAVHEMFHIHQVELAGDGALNGGFDDIPRAGT